MIQSITEKYKGYAPLFLRIIFAIYLYLALKGGVYTSEALAQYASSLSAYLLCADYYWV
jgi:hypothetical protein